MASDVDLINESADLYLANLESHRATATKHRKKERENNNLPPLRKGDNVEQSFWKPEEAIAVFRQEAHQALQEEAAAGRTHTFTSRHCALSVPVDYLAGVPGFEVLVQVAMSMMMMMMRMMMLGGILTWLMQNKQTLT